jgi:hypothetical protein
MGMFAGARRPVDGRPSATVRETTPLRTRNLRFEVPGNDGAGAGSYDDVGVTYVGSSFLERLQRSGMEAEPDEASTA